MEEKKPFNLHPIKLIGLRVSELSIKVDLSVPRELPSGTFSIETGRSDYDRESHQIQVRMRVLIGEEEQENIPFKLNVELNGFFEVDETKFNPSYVEDWAEKNAPLVLYPYLREQVYSLTGRAGFNETLLPLFEVPTYKFVPPEAPYVAK